MYTCTKCGETKTEDEFPHGKGRRHSWCKLCNAKSKAERRAKYREANPRKKRIALDYITDDGRIVCPKCNEAKLSDNFQDGRVGWCKACKAKYEADRRRANGIPERMFLPVADGFKTCGLCWESKALSEFSPAKRGSGGVAAYCKTCSKEKYSDREAARLATAKYRINNRERHLAAHRIRMWEYNNRKRVTRDGTVTDEFLRSLYEQEICNYCHRNIPVSHRTADHKIPLARGGKHSADNLVMACFSCNSSKRDLTDEEFKERIKHD